MGRKVTLIPGDGIGPEVAFSAQKILDEMGLDFDWEVVNAGEAVFEETGSLIPDDVFASIERTKLVLKGPITTPIGKGFRSINVQLRKKYDLYANIRPVKSTDGSNINMVIFRENTEGLYIGEEEQVSDTEAISVKRITRKGTERIVRAAFDYAEENNKCRVTVAHKANILKLTDGMFLHIAREIAEEYPDIELHEVIIDNMCMQMVMNPQQFEVVVTMNLYGDILSDLGAGLVGGLGLIPGANVGEELAIFEAVHGSAPDIAGKRYANPIAMIRSAVMMLDYLKEHDKAEQLDQAITSVLQKGEVQTRDLGGTASTDDLVEAILKEMRG